MVASLVILTALVLLDQLSLRYGADSRDGKDWQPMTQIFANK